jgi:hypothetical protein
VALGKLEVGLRSGGNFEGHGLSEICLSKIATAFNNGSTRQAERSARKSSLQTRIPSD